MKYRFKDLFRISEPVFLFECNGPLAQPADDCLNAMGPLAQSAAVPFHASGAAAPVLGDVLSMMVHWPVSTSWVK